MNIKPLKQLCIIGCVLLQACSSSKAPQLYVLNPLPFTPHHHAQTAPIRIAIDAINFPDYLDHPQLMMFTTENQGQLLEHYQWAEPVESNIQRVIQTNLSQQLPNAAVELAPWDSDFYPQYHLRIEISEFKVDMQGNSLLQAIYSIGADSKSLRQYQVKFSEKITDVRPAMAVRSMNRMINRLSLQIAQTFNKLRRQ